MTRQLTTILGMLMIFLGVLAIARPLFAAVTVVLVLGWLLLIAGAFNMLYAILTIEDGKAFFLWRLLPGIILLVLGALLLLFPVGTAQTVGILLGALILIRGIAQIILASQLRPLPGWSWAAVVGVVGVVLGFLILWGWPASGYIVIGTLIGILLITDGLWFVMSSRMRS